MKLDVIYNKSSQRMTELPDESIDMSLTSPPYWGLRDYGDDVKEIWGGDPDCEHTFNEYIRPAGGGHANADKAQVGTTKKDIQRIFGAKAAFCQKCGAWHGQLGLEPTFQLYLDHMMIVCAEIKRVLKKTGSFWLNMGDTYYSDCTVRKAGKDAFLRKGDSNYDEYLRSSVNAGVSKTHRRNFSQRELQSKCLIGIPWRLVLRLIDEQGWILRNAITWHKPNAMPSSVKDRCSNSYEFLFHLVKAKKYYYDLDAIREAALHSAGIKEIDENGYTRYRGKWAGKRPERTKDDGASWASSYGSATHPSGKNPGDVWLIPTQPRPEAHFATFPDKLCIKPILATCPAEICKKCGKARVRKVKTINPRPDGGTRNVGDRKDGYTTKLPPNPYAEKETIGWTDCGCNAGWDSGILLDPFTGRGTSLIMAKKLDRHYVGYELKKEYADMAERELEQIDPLFRSIK